MAFLDVLEKLLAWQIATVLHDAGQTTIVDTDRVPLAALAAELEPHGRSAHGDVLVLQRRQSKRAVRPGVLFVADADRAALEQLHDRREDLVASETGLRQIRGR